MNPINLAKAIVGYFGPRFQRLDSQLREIHSCREKNKDAQGEVDRIAIEALLNSARRNAGQPIRLVDLVEQSFNPRMIRMAERTNANGQEAATIHSYTLIEEGKRLSQILEGFSDSEIRSLKGFFEILGTKRTEILERLSTSDADGVNQIIRIVRHLAFGLNPEFVGDYLTIAAQEKLEKLNPRELMRAITPKE